jgi:hypothetical protein
MSKTYTIKVGRSAITGKFKTVKAAEQQKKTSIVQTIKVKKP